MANLVYNAAILGIHNQSIDFVNDAFKMRLVESGYVPDKDHDTMTDVGSGVGTDQPVSGTKTIEVDNANDFVFWKCDTNPEWTTLASGDEIVGAVLYKFVTDDDGSTPIAYYELTPTPTNGGSFEFIWNSDANGGVLKTASV